MRVLQIREGDGSGSVDLHTHLTLIRASDPLRRAWLVDALRRLPGGGSGAYGLIEVNGIRFDLDEETSAVLGLDSSIDPLVDAASLPGHDDEVASATAARDRARASRDAAAESVQVARRRLEDLTAEADEARAALDQMLRGEGPALAATAAAEAERSRIVAEHATARDAVSAAESALGEAVLNRDALIAEHDKTLSRLDAARVRHRAAMDQAVAAAAAREAEQAARPGDDDPAAMRRSIEARLAEAEAKADALDPDRASSPLAAQIGALEARRSELIARAVALGDGDGSQVEAALRRVLERPDDGTPVVAALALADTWRDLNQQIGGLDAGASPEERAAEDAVHAAHLALIEAESQLNQPLLTPEQIARVEQAHSAVLEAQDRLDARFGRSRAQRRLDELRSDERRVLERLGFSTYADYMMSTSSRGVGKSNSAVADLLRTQYEDAQTELEALPGAADRARRRAELLARRDEVAPKIAELLGHEPTGPDVEDELRALREGGSTEAPDLEDLAGALEAAGMDVGPEPWIEEDLILLGRAYLAEEQTAGAERSETTVAVEAIESTLADLREAHHRGEREAADLSDLPALASVAPGDAADELAHADSAGSAWAEVESIREELIAADAAVAKHDEWRTKLTEVERHLAEATRKEADAAAAVTVAEAELDESVSSRIDEASIAVERAEADLARARSRESELAGRLADPSVATIDTLVATARADLAAKESAIAAAREDTNTASAVLASATDSLAMAEQDLASRRMDSANRDAASIASEVDWALLSRLSEVRSVGLAGSVPLVLDEPFDALPDEEVVGVLDRFLRMASAVQVVLFSDRPVIVDWVEGLDRSQSDSVSV